MKVKFTEGPAAVTLPDGERVERGHQVDVDSDTGKALVAQGWEKVGARKSGGSRTTNPKGKNTADALEKSSTPPADAPATGKDD